MGFVKPKTMVYCSFLFSLPVALFMAPGGVKAEPTPWKPGVSWKDLSYESLKVLHDAGVACIEVSVAAVMTTPAPQREEKCRQIVADAQRGGVTLWSGHAKYQGPFLFETSKHKDGTPVKLPEMVDFVRGITSDLTGSPPK